MDRKQQNAKDKQAQRDREKSKGIKRVEVKAHVDDEQDVRNFADDKLKQRGF
jgi:hypothetical protein